MNAMLSRSRAVGTIVLVAGDCGLSAAGILHVSLTSQLYRWFAAFVPHGLSIVGPPFLLNHLVVGVLLLATGLTTCIAAFDLRSGSNACWRIVLINTSAVIVLPLLLLTLMNGPFYRVSRIHYRGNSGLVIGNRDGGSGGANQATRYVKLTKKAIRWLSALD